MDVKRIHIISLLLSIVVSAHAQTMEWLCKPDMFTEIQYMGHDMFKVRGQNGKWGILSSDGNLMFKTEHDSITSFSENRLLILKGKKNQITHIVDQQGEIIQHFIDRKIYVTQYPYYKDGFLSVKDEMDLCGYLNPQGIYSINPRFYLAAPFQEGLATVQYNDETYGIIDKSGNPAIVDNTRYVFLSSLVDGYLFALSDSRSGGNLLRIMQLDGTKLKPVKKLETRRYVDLADDLSLLHSQNGHNYFIDEQLRIIGANYQLELPYEIKKNTGLVFENTELLSKQYFEDGIQITYKGSPILEKKFPDVETYEAKYAIVKNENHKPGILRLNPQARIELLASAPFVFYHNPLFDSSSSKNKEADLNRYSSIELDINNVDVEELKCYINDNGHLSYAPIAQDKDSNRLYLPYFQEDSVFNHPIEKELDIAITYDGLDWMHKAITVSSLHKEGFQVIVDDKVSFGDNGIAYFSIIVSPKGRYFQAPIRVVINQKEYLLKDGENQITLSEKVPIDVSLTFHYTIFIKEEGCPGFIVKKSKTIKRPKPTLS